MAEGCGAGCGGNLQPAAIPEQVASDLRRSALAMPLSLPPEGAGLRLERRQIGKRKTLAAGGRRTGKELGMPVADDRRAPQRPARALQPDQHHHRRQHATGAAECMAMHSGQWSASLPRGCMCATWTTVSSASRTRHSTATAGKARSFARGVRRGIVPEILPKTHPLP